MGIDWQREGETVFPRVYKPRRRRGYKEYPLIKGRHAQRVRLLFLTGRYTIKELADMYRVGILTISAILHLKTHRELYGDGLQLFVWQMYHMRRMFRRFTEPVYRTARWKCQPASDPRPYYIYLGEKIPRLRAPRQ